MCPRILHLAPILSLVFTLNAHSQEPPTKVGVLIPLTQDFARYGEKIRAGIENSKTPNFTYVYEDEGCQPAKAITSYKKLTSFDRVKYLLGPYCGSPQTAIAPLLKAAKQVAVLGASAPRSVFDSSGGRMFSTQHSIEEESIFNANKMHALGAKKVVLVFFENDFSRAHEKAFRETFPGEVLDTLAYTSQDISALKAVALRIKTLAPDSLYVPDAFPLMRGLIKELHQIGLGDKKVFSVYSAQSEDVLGSVGSQGEGLFYSYPAIGEHEALAYFPQLATKILEKAITQCGSADDTCVMASLKKDNRFDKYGVLEGAFVFKTIKDGKFVEVE